MCVSSAYRDNDNKQNNINNNNNLRRRKEKDNCCDDTDDDDEEDDIEELGNCLKDQITKRETENAIKKLKSVKCVGHVIFQRNSI